MNYSEEGVLGTEWCPGPNSTIPRTSLHAHALLCQCLWLEGALLARLTTKCRMCSKTSRASLRVLVPAGVGSRAPASALPSRSSSCNCSREEKSRFL